MLLFPSEEVANKVNVIALISPTLYVSFYIDLK